jgi:mannitol-1-/sugar-/sorbitol-6-/2-deoxyglucose-6-phosphatase
VIKACIFDMDGVLVDTEPAWRRVECEVFERVGLRLSDEQLRQTWGLRIDEVVDHWYRSRPWDGIRPRAVAREILRRMVEHVRTEDCVLPGASEAIRTVREMGMRVAIASSSSRALIDAVVQRLDVSNSVDVLCSADDEVLGKPDPAIYRTAARLLACAPVECVAIEDSPRGIASAKAAGMACVAVRGDATVPDEALAAADVVLGSLHEFTPELLHSLSPREQSLVGERAARSADADAFGE